MQMKRIRHLRILAAALLCAALLCVAGCAENGADLSDALAQQCADGGSVLLKPLIDPSSEVRGVYIATVYNIDFPSKPDLDSSSLQKELDAILNTMQQAGLNAVFFQVRPACDALYRSDLFPVSASLYSDGVLHFDPLAYLIEQAHARNIFVHAWVNPLRVTTGSAVHPNTDISALPDGHPVRDHPDWAIAYADGRLYLDPGLPEVRTLVADGVREILENYNVDGVIFDDYFYPYPVTDASGASVQFNDGASYARYGAQMTRADWRRDNINRMIREVYDSVKSVSEDVSFGVAPFGIWKNDNGSNGGSATRGLQSYEAIYCDPIAWAEGGYVDYIAPQIYWRFSTEVAPYGELVRWWNCALDGTGVHLLISHAAYRYDEWASPEGEMSEQLQFARSELTYRGSIFYGFDEIRRDAFSIAGELREVYRSEIVYTEPSETGMPVHVSSPPTGTYIDAPNTYLIGSSSPDKPLTMNGEKIPRTRGGFFSVYTALEEGENTFVFEQGGQTYCHTIYRGVPQTASVSGGAELLSEFAVVSLSPAQDILRESGGSIPVSCVAPAGAEVTAQLGEITVSLTQTSASAKTREGYSAASYSGTIVLPEAGVQEIITAGRLRVCAAMGEKTAEAEGALVRVRGTGASIPVCVTKDHTELKLRQNSYYYDDFSVQSAGMTDCALWQGGGMYLLRVGGYVYEDSVAVLENAAAVPLGRITSAGVSSEGIHTYIRIGVDQNIPHNGTVRDGAFELTLYNIDLSTVPETVSVAENPLIRSVRVVYPNKANCVRFVCTLLDTENFYGFDFRYGDGCAYAVLQNPRHLSFTNETPLNGIRIVLDAGHGGSDTGALGPLAVGDAAIHEKDLNLAVTLAAKEKLETLGASVILTRAEDTTVSIQDRVSFLCDEMPDLVLSIHQNSLDYASDITGVRGTLGLWWADSGVLLARCVSASVAQALSRREMTPQQQRLALCRNPKFPSALIEVGFMTSVEEYEFMLNGGIERAAEGIANGILSYFREQSKWAENT